MVVKGREYVYFWHYEDREARSRQVYRYMGPKHAATTARRLAEAVEAYYARAMDEVRRRLAEERQSVAALRTEGAFAGPLGRRNP